MLLQVEKIVKKKFYVNTKIVSLISKALFSQISCYRANSFFTNSLANLKISLSNSIPKIGILNLLDLANYHI